MKKKIEFMPAANHHIAQIYGSGLQYALCSDKNEQACNFVYCKDFFQDAYQAYFCKTKRAIYGFSYDYKKNKPVSLKTLKLLLLNSSDKKFSNKISSAQDFMNQIEKDLKMRGKTNFSQVSNPPEWYKRDIWLVETNKRWYSSPVMLSLYTLLLRIGFVHKLGTNYVETIEKVCQGEIKPYQKNDHSYMKNGAKGLAYILSKGDKFIFGNDPLKNYPKNISIGDMHNRMGIVAFSNATCKAKFQNWYVGFEPEKINFEVAGKFKFSKID